MSYNKITIMPATPIILSIEGNIGSGKSTLVKNLENYHKKNSKICFLQEPVDIWNTIVDENNDTILTNYYKNQKKYAFPFQMMAYISRLSLLKKALKKDYNLIVTERSVLTDKMVFAKMLYDDKNIEEIEYSIYLKWFDEFIEELPELKIVYVQTDPIIAKSRVDKRAREGENIPLEYLINCDKYHNDWLYNKELDEMLIIDGNKDINLNPEFIDIWINDINNFANLTKKIYIGNCLLRFDGGSRGNPGLCGAGFVIYDIKDTSNINETSYCTIVDEGFKIVSENNTNNFAEYMALILGLKCAIKNNIKTLHIQGDSLLVINQIKTIFACNSDKLKPLLDEVYSLLLQFDDYSIEYIPRDVNYYSDKLANKAMDEFK